MRKLKHHKPQGLTKAGKLRKEFQEAEHPRFSTGEFSQKASKKQDLTVKPAGTSKAKVYDLADKMKGATKKQVLDAAVQQGVHPSTAANHYHYWQKAQVQKLASKPGFEDRVLKAEDPVTELKKTAGEALGLKAPAKGQSSKDKVYKLADEMQGKSKKEVIQAAVDQGVHPSTAANHYHYWSKAQKAEGVGKTKADQVADELEAGLKKAGVDTKKPAEEPKKPDLAPAKPSKYPESPPSTFKPKYEDEVHPSLQAKHTVLKTELSKHKAGLKDAKEQGEKQTKPHLKKYYDGQVKQYEGAIKHTENEIKAVEKQSEEMKGASSSGKAKTTEDYKKEYVHPSLSQEKKHQLQKHHYSGESAKTTGNSLLKAQYEKNVKDSAQALEDISKKSKELKAEAKKFADSPVMTKPVSKMTDEELAETASTLQAKAPAYQADSAKFAPKPYNSAEDYSPSSGAKALTAKMKPGDVYTHPTQGKTFYKAGDGSVFEHSGATGPMTKVSGAGTLEVHYDPANKITYVKSGGVLKPAQTKTPVFKGDQPAGLHKEGDHAFKAHAWSTANGIQDPDFSAGSKEGSAHLKAVHAKAGVDYSEAPVVKSYTGSGYQSINGALRKSEGKTVGPSAQKLDELISKSSFKEDTIMWRGVGLGGTVFNGAPPPSELVDHGFTSVSFKPSVASGFSDGKTVFRVKVPKGFPGLNVAMGSPGSGVAGLGGEAEVVLPRGTTYRVVERHKGKGLTKYGGGKTDVVDLEPVLPDWYIKKYGDLLKPALS